MKFKIFMKIKEIIGGANLCLQPLDRILVKICGFFLDKKFYNLQLVLQPYSESLQPKKLTVCIYIEC